MMIKRFLVIGCGEGWHANQLKCAAEKAHCEMVFCDYESLSASVGMSVPSMLTAGPSSNPISDFDAVLARTMPGGSLERITFRLSILHALAGDTIVNSDATPVINSPRGLEIAIDKFATLVHVSRLGYRVPETVVVQSRSEAIEAFRILGGDCVVKPIFGGEGRGVMRIADEQLAWTAFSVLDQLDSVFYVQSFIRPGGRDVRLMVIGDKVIAARRENTKDFCTNFSQGATTTVFEPTDGQIELARHVTSTMGLSFATVDLIDCEDGVPRLLEVNAVPGWKGLQSVCSINIAEQVVDLLQRSEATA